MSAWTPERKARQAEMMRRLRPWEKSTGPKTSKGKAKSSGNARKHGLRSQPAKDIAKARTNARRQDQEAMKTITHAEAVLRALGLLK